ncbi:putative membrane protein [Acinetobacter sp. 1130196]|nr:putative membrane protein [Acinetobacter sp. 1130196]
MLNPTKTLVNKYFKLIKMVWLNLILIKMVGYNKVIFISN